MRKYVHVLGLDPGLTNLGVCVVRITKSQETPIFFHVVRTKPSPKKMKIRSSDDAARRIRIVHDELCSVVEKYKPVAVCVESMSYPRNSSSSAKIGMVFGSIVSIANGSSTVLLQATPQEIKKSVCSKRDASKQEVYEALRHRYGLEATSPLADLPKTLREHPADALGAIVSCLGDPSIEIARRFLDD